MILLKDIVANKKPFQLQITMATNLLEKARSYNKTLNKNELSLLNLAIDINKNGMRRLIAKSSTIYTTKATYYKNGQLKELNDIQNLHSLNQIIEKVTPTVCSQIEQYEQKKDA